MKNLSKLATTAKLWAENLGYSATEVEVHPGTFHSVRLQRNFKTIEILFFQEIIEIRMSLDKITYKFGSIFTNTSDEKTKFTISIPNSNEDDLFEVFQWIRKLTLLGL